MQWINFYNNPFIANYLTKCASKKIKTTPVVKYLAKL